MATIVTRAGKGSTLTHAEVDANFTNLNSAKYESGNNVSFGTIDGTTISGTSFSSSGNLTFTGTGNRITGDFSNATLANRVAFQTSTVNGNTNIVAIPNGTSTSATVEVRNSSDPNNSSVSRIGCTSTEMRVNSSVSGTGTFLPMTFFTNNSERFRIDTSGNVGIGTNSPTQKLDIVGGYIRQQSGAGSVTGNHTLIYTNSNDSIDYGSFIDHINNGVLDTRIQSGGSDAVNVGLISFSTNTAGNVATERMRIDASGNVGIGTNSPTALLDVNSNNVRIRTSKTPASSSDTGNAGDICWDANYIYVCTATNTWKRTAITTW